MKKKLNKLGLVVALSMSLSLLGGCGKDNNDKKDNIETTATASAGVDASTASNATREFKEEDYKKLLDNWAGYCTLGEYKKIEYNAETVEVTDDMVKERVEALRNTFAVEDKIMEGSAQRLIKNLFNRNHMAIMEHEYITYRIICDRGVTHEIVRHRIANYAQESTRYVNYSSDKYNSEINVIDIATGFNYNLKDEKDCKKYWN